MISRRSMLKGASAAVLTATGLPGMSSSAEEKDVAVLSQPKDRKGLFFLAIQLEGGNDFHNTLVPYGLAEYYSLRPSLSVSPGEVLKLNNQFGLHPRLTFLRELYDRDLLRIIRGVGGEIDSPSHEIASEEWNETLLEAVGPGVDALPSRYASERSFEALLSKIGSLVSELKVDTFQLIRVSGFDTHRDQNKHHPSLLSTLDSGLMQLVKKAEASNCLHRLRVLVFSEFGRSLKENEDKGTDHGGVSGCFLIGMGLEAELDNCALPFSNSEVVRHEIGERELARAVFGSRSSNSPIA